MKLAIFTAIFARRDRLRRPPPGPYDFHCFTDDPSLPGGTRIDPPMPWDLRRSARRVKCLPHHYLPEYDAWIWVDGSMSWKPEANVERLVELGGQLGAFSHEQRDCPYEEAELCARNGLDDAGTIFDQMRRYRRLGYPPHSGLSETGLLVRRNTPLVRAFNEAWWEELFMGSKRDQLSFNFSAHHLKMRVNSLGKRSDNPWVKLMVHLQDESATNP